MNYKETLFFISYCLSINEIEKNRILVESKLKLKRINWDNIVKVSTKHYVLPALYLNLKRYDFLSYLPKDLVDYMEYITNLNRKRNRKIIKQAKEINQTLIKNGVYPIFLKGTGNLLEGLYEDIGERMIGDIDILVESSLFLKTVKTLKKNGYESNKEFLRTFKWHYPELTKSNCIASVEVHKKILKDNFQENLKIDFYKNLLFLDTKFCFLSDQNKLYATILPKIINDNLYHSKKISLRNAYDILLLAKNKNINFQDIENYKMKKKFNNYLNCIKLLFNNTQLIATKENKKTTSYLNSFEKLLEGNFIEKNRIQIIDFLVKNKNRFIILKLSFKNQDYRNYALKRITKIDFYKMILGFRK